MNDGFIRFVGGEWTGNLDAFNDYLKWPDKNEYQLEIVALPAAQPRSVTRQWPHG